VIEIEQGSIQFYQPMNPPRVPPIITLTTDFGSRDHYVGTMKGVLLGRCPNAQLVDISHEIPAFSILSAAYTIDQAAPYFPAGTVHLVVVDPGVGTSRKALCVEALGQSFIAPDNGVLSLVLARDRSAVARELTSRNFWLDSPSSTFHGRDIFAPAAAALASGAARPEELGPVLSRIEILSDLEPEPIGENHWRATILSIDHFGNAITNLKRDRFYHVSFTAFMVEAGAHRITAFYETFGAAPPGVPFLYFGSSGYLELGMNQHSAAAALSVSPGARITLRVS
jgi:S-adenosyl-L-methionine hydrolase (adenosine-forming)